MTQARRYVDPLWDTCIGMLDDMWTKTGLLNGKETTDEWMIDAFKRHTEEVKATVPADRLLVWSPGDGWEPLCELLELPVPDAPLPQVNDAATFGLRLIDGGLAAVQAHREADAVPRSSDGPTGRWRPGGRGSPGRRRPAWSRSCRSAGPASPAAHTASRRR